MGQAESKPQDPQPASPGPPPSPRGSQYNTPPSPGGVFYPPSSPSGPYYPPPSPGGSNMGGMGGGSFYSLSSPAGSPSPYHPQSPGPALVHSNSFGPPQSPGGSQFSSTQVALSLGTLNQQGAEMIPYTNYSVEKTPEKETKQQKRTTAAPHVIVDDPILDKFKRAPSFLPILGNKKLFEEVDPKGILAILTNVMLYHNDRAKFIHRENTGMVNSIRQMEMACEKAGSLALQHYTQVQKFSKEIPNVEQMCVQLSQTHATMTKVVATINHLEAYLDALTNPPPPSPVSTHSSPLSTFSTPSPPSPHSPSLTLVIDDPTGSVVRPPRPRRPNLTGFHDSPYLAAKPRGAAPLRARSVSDTLPSSPPSASADEVWNCKIIPQWEQIKVRDTPWVRSMWKTGIPKSVRGKVWRLAIGNDLGLTKETFESLFEGSTDSAAQMDAHRDIEVDLARTFAHVDVGDLDVFRGKLWRVLKAYSKFKSDVQGMSYLAGMLLQYMDDFDSFVCMSNLLENKFLNGLFRLDTEAIDQYISIFSSLLHQIEPKLDKHFAEVGLIPQHYLLQWWFPIFSKSLPMEICGKVWDCFLLEGEIFAFVASLGILRMYKKTLKKMDMEACKKLLSNLPTDILEEELFVAIESIPAPLYNSYLEKIHKAKLSA